MSEVLRPAAEQAPPAAKPRPLMALGLGPPAEGLATPTTRALERSSAEVTSMDGRGKVEGSSKEEVPRNESAGRKDLPGGHEEWNDEGKEEWVVETGEQVVAKEEQEKVVPTPVPCAPAAVPDVAPQPLAFPPAVPCGEVPRPRPAPGPHLILAPVQPLLSPSCFSVRLASAEAGVVELTAALTAIPPPEVPGWKVGRQQAVALLHGGTWSRGVAAKKVGAQLSVYRLDHGDLVTVAMAAVRPLPAQHLAPAAGALQCCMVGLGPVEGGEVWQEDTLHLFASLVSGDPAYPLLVEVVGRVAGGRWAVRLLGATDGQDVAELMVEAGLAVRRGDMEALLPEPALATVPLHQQISRAAADTRREQQLALGAGQARQTATCEAKIKEKEAMEKGMKEAKRLEQEAEREAKVKADKELKDKAVKDSKVKAEKEAMENAEREARVKGDKIAKDKAKKEVQVNAEKEAKEKADREDKEKAEKVIKVEAEKEGIVKAEKEAKMKADREAKEKADRAAKEKAENKAKLKEEKETKEKADKEAKMKLEKEAKEKALRESKKKEEAKKTAKSQAEAKLKEEKEGVKKKTDQAKQKADKEAKDILENQKTEEVKGNAAVAKPKEINTTEDLAGREAEQMCSRTAPQLARGRMPTSGQVLGVVTHLDSPSSFYVCLTEAEATFIAIMAETQEPEEGVGAAEVGAACLALSEDGCWYRAEVEAVEGEQATVFLVDHGQRLEVAVAGLRRLTRHLEVPGLVARCGLAGVRPTAGAWTTEEVEAASMVLGVGQDVQLQVEVVGEQGGVTMVKIKDEENNDMAALLVESGLARTGAALTYGELSTGSLIVFAASSPTDLHLSSPDLFQVFNDKVRLWRLWRPP